MYIGSVHFQCWKQSDVIERPLAWDTGRQILLCPPLCSVTLTGTFPSVLCSPLSSPYLNKRIGPDAL